MGCKALTSGGLLPPPLIFRSRKAGLVTARNMPPSLHASVRRLHLLRIATLRQQILSFGFLTSINDNLESSRLTVAQ